MLKFQCDQLLFGDTNPASVLLAEMHPESMVHKAALKNISTVKHSKFVYFSPFDLGITPPNMGACDLCWASISFCVLILIKTNILYTLPN